VKKYLSQEMIAIGLLARAGNRLQKPTIFKNPNNLKSPNLAL